MTSTQTPLESLQSVAAPSLAQLRRHVARLVRGEMPPEYWEQLHTMSYRALCDELHMWQQHHRRTTFLQSRGE